MGYGPPANTPTPLKIAEYAVPIWTKNKKFHKNQKSKTKNQKPKNRKPEQRETCHIPSCTQTLINQTKKSKHK